MPSSEGVVGGGGGRRGQGYMEDLLEKLNYLDQLQKDQDRITKNINEIHRKLWSYRSCLSLDQSPADGNLGFCCCSLPEPLLPSPEMNDKQVDNTLLRLRALYTRAKELCESEVSVSSALVGLLDGLLQSGASSAQRKKIEIGEHKRKRMKSDTDTTRFSSASMRSQLDHATNLKGEQVAAKVKSDEEKDEWVVVKVIHFDKETKEYEVFDEEPGDDEESAQKLLVALLPAAVVSQWMAMSGKGSVCVRLLICLARSDVTTTLVSGVSLWSMQMVGSMCT